MKLRSSALALLGALVLALATPTLARADKLQDILEAGVIRVTVFGDVPPFGSQNVNRELEGFDIDLAHMVAEALGVELELVQATAANRIPYLLTDKSDVNIAAMSVTAERAKQVLYSAPYADTSLAVFGPVSAEIATAGDIGTLSTAVAKGTTEDIMLTAAAPDAEIMRTEDNATAVRPISRARRTCSPPTASWWPSCQQNPNAEFDFKFALRRAPAHITVRMGEHNLLRWLDTFIFQQTLNGELNALHVKWLGGPMQPLPPL